MIKIEEVFELITKVFIYIFPIVKGFTLNNLIKSSGGFLAVLGIFATIILKIKNKRK